jgi:DNA-binding transcriptional MerR regulator
VFNEKNLSSNEVEWIFLLKRAKDLGLSIDDIKRFIVENKPISK